MTKNIKLNNGLEIPPVGLGTYQGKGLENVIELCIDLGYKLFDTAFIYENETQIGNALSKKFKEGAVKREDLFIVSKLWNTKHNPKDVIPAIKKSLSELKVEYLDLYLMHWPLSSKPVENQYEIFGLKEEDAVSIEDTWLAMEECVKLGYTKSIGLSNFNSQQIDRILKIATIKPVVNQVECNVYINQKKLIEFCKQRDIQIMAYSPFYGVSKVGGESHGLNMFDEPIIKELSEKYKKTAGQIILRYLVQLGTIPIPKSDNPERLKQNISIFDFVISDEDIVKLESLNKNLRCVTMELAKHYKEYPFDIEF